VAQIPLNQHVGITIVCACSAAVIFFELSAVLNFDQESCAIGLPEPFWHDSCIITAGVSAIIQNTESVCWVESVVWVACAAGT
jgi:hypothetical protein